jgi:hypothetical protein
LSRSVAAVKVELMAKAIELLKQAAQCRDLAKRARRLAGTLVDGPDMDELLGYTQELEAQASSLEKQASSSN